jgi:hypothetical protein
MTQGMSLELARELVELRADAEIQQRYDYLADGHTAGKLSPEEQAELAALVEANTVVSVLKAEARVRLKAEQK